jgi:dUTP pyrophosphatase
MVVRVINRSKFPLPEYATEHAAGFDLRANISTPEVLEPGARSIVPTGIYVALPDGTEMQIRPRSGLAAKHGVTVLNAPGTIDADYRGEIGVILINLSKEDFVIQPGERIAQAVVAQYERINWEETESLDETNRGIGGFGSTGIS